MRRCARSTSCIAGDICALTKLGTAETGDTVSAAEHPLLLSCWDLPRAAPARRVVARTRGDEDALVKTLAKIVAADPALRLERNQETHQTILWCMGEAHADVVLSRLRAGGAEVDTEPVRVPLRATLAGPARVTGRHVKQSGGHGQYAVCHVEFEPLPRGAGIEFVDKIFGGSVPHQFIPSVEKGVRAQAARGADRGPPPGRRLPRDARGRQGPQRRLLRRRVPDRGRARAARGGGGVRRRASWSRTTR